MYGRLHLFDYFNGLAGFIHLFSKKCQLLSDISLDIDSYVCMYVDVNYFVVVCMYVCM